MSVSLAETRNQFASTIAMIDQLEAEILNTQIITPEKLVLLGVTHRDLIHRRNALNIELQANLRVLETIRPFQHA